MSPTVKSNILRTLSSTVPKKQIIEYKLPNEKKLTQKEFFKYFDNVSDNLRNMKKREKTQLIVRARMSSIKDQLNNIDPIRVDAILQMQLEYAYFKWKDVFNSRALKEYSEYLEKEKMIFLKAFNITDIDVEVLDNKTKWAVEAIAVTADGAEMSINDAKALVDDYVLTEDNFEYKLHQIPFNGARITSAPESYYFFPISSGVIDKNPNIEQNSNWGGTFNPALD